MPKYLEIDPVECFNSRMDGLQVGDVHLFIRIEPYSLKLTAQDKKILGHLRHQISSPDPNKVKHVMDPVQPQTDHRNHMAHGVKRPNAALEDSHTDVGDPIPSPPTTKPRTRVSSLTAILPLSPTRAPPVSPSRKVNRNVHIGSGTSTPIASHTLVMKSPGHLGGLLSPTAVSTTLTQPSNAGSKQTNANELAVKALTGFINAMNASYPDFDFSDSGPDSFRPVSLVDLRTSMHTLLVHGQDQDRLEDQLWQVLNSAFKFGKLHKSSQTQLPDSGTALQPFSVCKSLPGTLNTDLDSPTVSISKVTTDETFAHVSTQTVHVDLDPFQFEGKSSLTSPTSTTIMDTTTSGATGPASRSLSDSGNHHLVDLVRYSDLNCLRESDVYLYDPQSESNDPLYEEGTMYIR